MQTLSTAASVGGRGLVTLAAIVGGDVVVDGIAAAYHNM
jgi:hypothetical protein